MDGCLNEGREKCGCLTNIHTNIPKMNLRKRNPKNDKLKRVWSIKFLEDYAALSKKL